MEQFARQEKLLTHLQMKKLKDASVIIFGVGGVGGYVVECLARAGIGNLTLVDFDVVSESNINRQICAMHSTVGMPKVSVLQKRVLDINPKAKVSTMQTKFSSETAEELLSQNYTYIIDAIDDVTNKLLLIKTAKQKGYNIVSALGAGNRYDIPHFEVLDIFKTTHDGLAKKMRKQLKDAGITALDVVSTRQPPLSVDGTPGSISYFPAMCGLVISAFVINKIIQE